MLYYWPGASFTKLRGLLRGLMTMTTNTTVPAGTISIYPPHSLNQDEAGVWLLGNRDWESLGYQGCFNRIGQVDNTMECSGS